MSFTIADVKHQLSLLGISNVSDEVIRKFLAQQRYPTYVPPEAEKEREHETPEEKVPPVRPMTATSLREKVRCSSGSSAWNRW